MILPRQRLQMFFNLDGHRMIPIQIILIYGQCPEEESSCLGQLTLCPCRIAEIVQYHGSVNVPRPIDGLNNSQSLPVMGPSFT
jgi:hypothetical protein